MLRFSSYFLNLLIMKLSLRFIISTSSVRNVYGIRKYVLYKKVLSISDEFLGFTDVVSGQPFSETASVVWPFKVLFTGQTTLFR